jgi:hypothetical protein
VWPHSLQLALGDALVVVGTDDDLMAAALQPWVAPTAASAVRTPDFGLELHPEPPIVRAQPRTLPSLQHGTLVIGRSTDAAALRDGLLRTLSSVHTLPAAATVRLAALPLLFEGGVVLAPREVADQGSLRRLRNAGYSPVYVPSVSVDTVALQVHIPAPLDGSAAAITAPLREWWVPAVGADAATAAGWTIGQVAAAAVPQIALPWFDDEAEGPRADALATDALRALIALIERVAPRVGRFHP